jgi:protein SCO1/2
MRRAVVFMVLLACHRAWAPPPPLGAFPDFALTDQTGKPVRATDLRGKVWVADFIFTRCASVCPLLTEHMAHVEAATRELGDRVAFVSFSVDPDFDTPAVLTAYAAAHHADLGRWRFLTGPIDAVAAGAKLALERDPSKPPPQAILHGTHFLLVDAAGQLRGYTESDDPEAVAKLKSDLAALVERPK